MKVQRVVTHSLDGRTLVGYVFKFLQEELFQVSEVLLKLPPFLFFPALQLLSLTGLFLFLLLQLLLISVKWIITNLVCRTKCLTQKTEVKNPFIKILFGFSPLVSHPTALRGQSLALIINVHHDAAGQLPWFGAFGAVLSVQCLSWRSPLSQMHCRSTPGPLLPHLLLPQGLCLSLFLQFWLSQL